VGTFPQLRAVRVTVIVLLFWLYWPRDVVAALQRAEVDYTRKCTTDVVVGIATHYGLDGPGIESIFCSIQNSFEVHPDFSGIDTGPFLGLKRSENCADHPLPSSTRFRMGWRYTSAPSPVSMSWSDLYRHYQQHIFDSV